GQCLNRRNRDRVSRVHAHRIEVLDAADDHDVILEIAHNLQLKFFPSDNRFFDQNLVGGAQIQPPPSQFFKLFCIERNAPSGSSQREGRPYDGGISNPFDDLQSLVEIMGNTAFRSLEIDLTHGVLEQLSILSNLDGFDLCPDQFYAILIQDSFLRERH